VTIKRFLSLRLAPAAWVGLVLLAALSLFPAASAQADPIAVQRASLQADGSGWSLDARFDFDLNNSLEDAVNKGVPLYFTTDFNLSRPRWYWFDEEPVNVSQSIRLSFQPLTREYRVSTGGLQLGFATLAEALGRDVQRLGAHAARRCLDAQAVPDRRGEQPRLEPFFRLEAIPFHGGDQCQINSPAAHAIART
jgi:hypothetical protein